MPLSKLKKWISAQELMARWNLDALNLSAAVIEHNISVFCDDTLERNLYIWPLGERELSQEIEEYYFRADEIINFEKKMSDEKDIEENKLKHSQRHQERCRAIAEMLLEKKPAITIADMIQKKEIKKIGCEGVPYTDKTLRKWINDLCPDRSHGRRPKEK